MKTTAHYSQLKTPKSMSRGIRNNNPLNIRRTATKWKGQRPEQTDPHFVQFTAMEWGIRAAFCLLGTYADKYGLRSVEQIVSRWAPPSENNTESYIANVCRMTGFTPTQPLERRHWAVLLQAMARIETGKMLPMETIRQGEALYQHSYHL